MNKKSRNPDARALKNLLNRKKLPALRVRAKHDNEINKEMVI
jgi:hypothetical protein